MNASTARTIARQFAAPFSAVLALNIVARGQALFAPMYSIDSYDVARKSFGGEIAYSLGDGRFIRAALWWLQAQLGFLPIESMSASICLAIPLFIIAGFVFAAAIFDDLKQAEAFAFAALFTLHPFATEYFYYGEVTFATILAFLSAALAIWSAYRAPQSLVWRCATVAAVVLALGNYQIVIGHIAAGGLLVLVARMCAGRSASGLDCYAFLGDFSRRTAVLVAGAAVYLACLVLTRYFNAAVASGRAYRTGLPDFSHKLHAVGPALKFCLFPPQGIVPTTISVATILGLAMCVFLLLQMTMQGRNRIAALVVGSAVALAAICAAAASLIGDVSWQAPRLFSPIALCIAALGVAGFRLASAGRKFGLVAISAIVITGYVGADASIFSINGA